jgi:hypothetical protein
MNKYERFFFYPLMFLGGAFMAFPHIPVSGMIVAGACGLVFAVWANGVMEQ